MKEKKEKKEKVPMDKAKKKKIIRRSIFGAAAALIVLFMVRNSINAGNALPTVYTMPVTRGDVEQIVSTSGTVKTEESKTYFAPLAVRVGAVDAAAGDKVKKGQKLYAYDEEALADEKLLAELKMQSNEGEYESSVIKNNQYISELGEANINLDVLDRQIEDSENYVKELNQRITDKQDSLALEGALLQISLLDWQNDPGSEEYMNLQKLVQLNTYEQQHNEEIEMWQKEVKEYEEKIAAYKEYRSEMKSQKSSSESGSLNSGSKSKLVADTQIERINAEETLASIEKVEGGVLADFDGVITEMSAVEGSTPTVGAQMVTLESTEKVKVEISVSKYDLQKIAAGQEADVTIAGNVYQGRVAKVNGMATINNSGAAVVGVDIGIENPDSGIFLGVEAKVAVHTDVAEQALVVPIEVINSDQEGSFVYTVENGILMKKRITTGISSNTLCEITEGLNEGDQIVGNVITGLEEGMAVTAIEE
ncbi:MAG: efflux RND transporter periplasmic adaptor subunit [Blautia sp.]|nr:efflux RND transporter periplasmic adaptor subunit [Blautia sp.]MCM1199707.1 efflux RND transporter periplasmic adaptor subunit [Bacteroides fragilis]